MIPAAVELKGANGDWRNLVIGPVLQCLEAATLGMPFEVWKTYMGRNRDAGTLQALREIYSNAGGGAAGVAAFWRGTSAKMVESASKGAILVYAKERLNSTFGGMGISPGLAGAMAGAGGGVCQVTIMGPCTFLVTGAVTGNQSESTLQRISRTYSRDGIRGFYPGGTAIAFRQMTNWASRQGFTEAVRDQFRSTFHGDHDAKLTKGQEVGAGIVGGMLACWNHPFEVARIEAQARADQGQKSLSMPSVMSMIAREHGVAGLFKGLVPRMCLGVWQTLFMVTGAKMVMEAVQDFDSAAAPAS